MNKLAIEKGRNTQRFSNPEATHRMTQNGIRHWVGKASNGGRQRNRNEDSIATLEYNQIFNSVSYPFGIYILSDGLGGYSGGEIASSLAVKTITQQLLQPLILNYSDSTPQTSYRTLLENAVFTANEKIYQQAQIMENEMGATLTAALIAGRIASVMNVGDSRAYLFNQEDGLQLITQDHSLVFRFYLMGELKLEDIYEHPQRNQILRALGEAGLRENLQEMMEQSNHPYFYQFTLEQGDTLLLCSDGLWQEVRDHAIEKMLYSITEPQRACDELVKLANHQGGHDNISIIIVKIM